MDFTGSISTLSARTMPFLAILRHDLRALCTSWLVRLWLAATALLTLILLTSSWHNPELRTAPLIALLLFPYLVLLVFLWFPVNHVLNMFSLEEFSPISLTQALPTLLRRPWSDTPSSASGNALDPAAAMAALERATSGWRGVVWPQPKPTPASGSNAFDRADVFEDFSLGSVVLGYGIPTLLAISLATVCFCRRDLAV